MNTTFTGSTRRPRNVNLSGITKNPFAPKPSSSSHTSTSSHTNSAVAQAQADRLRRQQEREQTNAAKKVQRIYRGHASRTVQRNKWREEWDQKELERLKLDGVSDIVDEEIGKIDYTRRQPRHQRSEPMRQEGVLHEQSVRLLLFLDVMKDHMDRWRLCYFCHVLAVERAPMEGNKDMVCWLRIYRKLARFVSKALRYWTITSQPDKFTKKDSVNQIKALLETGSWIAGRCPDVDYGAWFEALTKLTGMDETGQWRKEVGTCVKSLLGNASTSTNQEIDLSRRNEFIFHFMGSHPIHLLPGWQKCLFSISEDKDGFDPRVMADGVVDMWDDLDLQRILNILANTVYLWRIMENAEVSDWMTTDVEDVNIAWSSLVGLLLSKAANFIAEHIDGRDVVMSGTIEQDKNKTQISSFVREQLNYLPTRDTVDRVMHGFQTSLRPVEDLAKPLANYAVALLRAFPTKAINIRMWIFQSTPSNSENKHTKTAIQYLWQATKITNIFKRICKDKRDVVSVLIEPRKQTNQINQAPISEQEELAWQADWRITLFFLELYSFVLKVMDDEEFFAHDQRTLLNLSAANSKFASGALPLQDLALLGNFLKNLAFSLYWYAADLAESNEEEEETTIASIFSARPATVRRKAESKLLAGNDVSQAYMKALCTGVLRGLHERDSRRTFLPDKYWLMIDPSELKGFVMAVVEEEERRWEHAEDEMEDEDVEIDVAKEDEPTSNDFRVPQIGSLFNIRAPHTSLSQSTPGAERLAREREQARKRRQLQSLVPRLEILRNLPFFIPFEARVQIFRTFIYRDQYKRRNGYVQPDEWRMSISRNWDVDHDLRPVGANRIRAQAAAINRDNILEDARDAFYDIGENFKEPIQIAFIDRFGEQEAGIDGGGVTKEFLISVTSEAFDPNSYNSPFEENEQRYLYPRPTYMDCVLYDLAKRKVARGSPEWRKKINDVGQQWEFLGRIVGKCMYEGILIDVNFPGFFLLKWILTGGTTSATNESAFHATVNDLRDFDSELYHNLLKLKNYPGDVEQDLGLTFTVDDTFMYNGKMVNVSHDLDINGSQKPVTSSNRLRYIDRLVRYRLQQQPQFVTNAFLRGLKLMISPLWLAMFNQRELQRLVGGDTRELDIQDLRRNTEYGGLYVIGDDGMEHPTISMFWKVLRDMDDQDRRRVLKFVTSTPRAPLLGFSNLTPRFSIRDSSSDQTRLPSTSTCVNLLKLPLYKDERTLKEKLLYAAKSGAGFDLS